HLIRLGYGFRAALARREVGASLRRLLPERSESFRLGLPDVRAMRGPLGVALRLALARIRRDLAERLLTSTHVPRRGLRDLLPCRLRVRRVIDRARGILGVCHVVDVRIAGLFRRTILRR